MKKSTNSYLTIQDQSVLVWRKKIKNLHLRVLKPDGQVRVSAPYQVTNAQINRFVSERMEWIKAAQQQLADRVIKPQFQYITGEQHLFFGQFYSLMLISTTGKCHIKIDEKHLHMFVRSNTTKASKQKLLDRWYRSQLLNRAEDIIERWQPIIGKRVSECRIKNMKTRWGTCHITKARIWLNLLLAQYPPECLEYIVVHEMTHLHERLHNRRFYALMAQYLPDWRKRQSILRTPY